MLVLSREKFEKIVIGKPGDVLTKPIVIEPVQIRGDKVRLGIEAQRDVSIHRSEVVAAIEGADNACERHSSADGQSADRTAAAGSTGDQDVCETDVGGTAESEADGMRCP